jgi:hypothetical protein
MSRVSVERTMKPVDGYPDGPTVGDELGAFGRDEDRGVDVPPALAHAGDQLGERREDPLDPVDADRTQDLSGEFDVSARWFSAIGRLEERWLI